MHVFAKNFHNMNPKIYFRLACSMFIILHKVYIVWLKNWLDIFTPVHFGNMWNRVQAIMIKTKKDHLGKK